MSKLQGEKETKKNKDSLSECNTLKSNILASDWGLGECFGEVIGKLQLLVVGCQGRELYFVTYCMMRLGHLFKWSFTKDLSKKGKYLLNWEPICRCIRLGSTVSLSMTFISAKDIKL